MIHFFETMFFSPRWYHYPVILLFLPLSLLYGIFMFLRRIITSPKSFDIPIISVGNLIVGGSGKTPFVIALASRYEAVTIISRGYGRQSKGLIEVSQNGQILTSVTQSGDEAMLMANSLQEASVIVSEDRKMAIDLAKSKGAKLIILDDGFNRVEIKKFEILLEPATIKNYFPFPSGAFREFWFMRNYANLCIKEEKDFTRKVTFENETSTMVLVTAISNPQRLNRYLPKNVTKKIYFEDHAYFNEVDLEKQMQECDAQSILVTEKDAVKMLNFKLPLSLMKLELEINEDVFLPIDTYIKQYK